MATTQNKKIATRQDAVVITNNFIANLTPEKAKTCLMPFGIANITFAQRMAETLGVLGWYYDADCTVFCSFILVNAVVSKAIEFFDNTNKN